jgi:hypothetical protein
LKARPPRGSGFLISGVPAFGSILDGTGGVASSSPAIPFLKPRMAWPSPAPSSGSFLVPNSRTTTNPMTSNSGIRRPII